MHPRVKLKEPVFGRNGFFFCLVKILMLALFEILQAYSPAFAVRSFITSEAMISPTTEGTNAILPGACRVILLLSGAISSFATARSGSSLE